MNRTLKITITIILTLFLASLVFYPKYKPFLAARFGPRNIKVSLMQEAQQKLNETGFIVVPTTNNSFPGISYICLSIFFYGKENRTHYKQ
jgi:hypothetical protein